MAILTHPPLPTQAPLGPEYAEASEDELRARIQAVRDALGAKLVILGHHYQRDEVIAFADFTGDSYKLAQDAAAQDGCETIVFCGVHFMAESADILAQPHQQVLLPDMKAGCSMADMADIDQARDCWEVLERLFPGETTPITYMNSTAAIKALCGEHEGVVCTSSNAQAAFEWARASRPRVLFLPDEHLGRNTAFALGTPLDDMVVWDPWAQGPNAEFGGNTEEALRNASVILWKGCCSIHQRFLPEHAAMWRERVPGVQILVHPECRHDVVQTADRVGSTSYIIKQVEAAPAGSKWAIGTEHHLIARLAKDHPDQTIFSLAGIACQCATMYRI
ncbi:MAG: quinolinate synthase NadA, partial [Planctomycetota bacterium]